jgi:hypothetical protein
MDVYWMELGIRLSFGKTSEFRWGGFQHPKPHLGTPPLLITVIILLYRQTGVAYK